MKASVKLSTHEKETENGFPVVLTVSHLGKKARKVIGHAKETEWIISKEVPRDNHPDYMKLYERVMRLRARSLSLSFEGALAPAMALQRILGEKKQRKDADFFAWCDEKIGAEMQMAVQLHERDQLKRSSSVISNANAYSYALSRMRDFYGRLSYSDINYARVMDFKNHLTAQGLKKTTVSHYLRSFRFLYNELCRHDGLENLRPFRGVFKGLSSRGYASQKKYLHRIGVLRMELRRGCTLAGEKYIALWLLQFYFGGADLKDVYYLQNDDFYRDRVRFRRGKVEDAPPVDIKVHPKAAAILKKYRQPGKYTFPWRKDAAGYDTFRNRMRRYLYDYQKKNNVQVHPDGGNLGIKVARHTFANLAKRLGIDYEIRRELMGHRDGSVAGYYEDLHDSKRRYTALFQVIEGREL